MTKRLVVLVSGRGSNLQSILAACRSGQIPDTQVVAVISNRPAARALELAMAAGIPALTVDHRDYETRTAFDAALQQQIDEYAPDIVALAWFMRQLTPAFVQRYEGKLLNVHPSLLPAFPGLHTHAQALQQGVCWHGASVHFVTAELDAGPIIIQAAVAVLPTDDEQSLATRVLDAEHRIYPQALAWLVSGRVTYAAGRTQWRDPPQTATRTAIAPSLESSP
ncbi:MAG: phosphoribosylglycinamide formyltransferase [Acidithiobacillus ferrivorans]